MRLFRHREDRLPILVITLMFAADVLVWSTVSSVPWLVLWTLVNIIPKGCVCAWNHHHQHLSTFEHPVLNRLIELVYAFHTGLTSQAWVLHHSLGHHQTYLDQTKDESRWQRDDGTPMGEWEYTLAVSATAYPRAWAVGARFPKVRRLFVAMAAVTLAILAGLLVARPLPTVFVFALPMLISLVLTSWATYTHHTGLETGSHFVACNNNLHRAFNVATGNLGYHTAHHYRPGVHWSRLPALHATIAHKIPAHCYSPPAFPWSLLTGSLAAPASRGADFDDLPAVPS